MFCQQSFEVIRHLTSFLRVAAVKDHGRINLNLGLELLSEDQAKQRLISTKVNFALLDLVLDVRARPSLILSVFPGNEWTMEAIWGTSERGDLL